jgi:hypothetical protein
MKVKFGMLLVAVLLVASLAVANAMPLRLSGVKKADEIWLNSGDRKSFGMFDGWHCDDFVEGVKLTGNNSPKMNYLHSDYSGNDSGHYAIFKKGKLKRWGEYQFNSNSNDFEYRKLKKKLFNEHEWKWSKEDDKRDGDKQDNDRGNNRDGLDDNDGNGNQDKKNDWSDNDGGNTWDEKDYWSDSDGGNNWGGHDGDPKGATSVPEPATMLLLGAGLIGLAGFARKKFNN